MHQYPKTNDSILSSNYCTGHVLSENIIETFKLNRKSHIFKPNTQKLRLQRNSLLKPNTQTLRFKRDFPQLAGDKFISVPDIYRHFRRLLRIRRKEKPVLQLGSTIYTFVHKNQDSHLKLGSGIC